MANMYWQDVSFTMQESGPWNRVIDTGRGSPDDIGAPVPMLGPTVLVNARSVLMAVSTWGSVFSRFMFRGNHAMAASTHEFQALTAPQRRSDRSNGSLPVNGGTLAHGLPTSITCSARLSPPWALWLS
jgi:hypothetical protein